VGDDKIFWPHDAKGKFTIKSFYREVCEASSNLDFPTNAISRSKASTKACFLAWAATKGKVPTKYMLKRRNFNLGGRCLMCRQEEASIDHLLFILGMSSGSSTCHSPY